MVVEKTTPIQTPKSLRKVLAQKQERWEYAGHLDDQDIQELLNTAELLSKYVTLFEHELQISFNNVYPKKVTS